MITIVILHKNREKVERSVNYSMFKNEEEFIEASEEKLLAIVKNGVQTGSGFIYRRNYNYG
ncbi:MAG: hypothetical protein ABS944_13100 [Solibacillus sp.]|uniref:hypothetical protein n=1 Tax=unclassified Solibacillus TaxID=2637870 RepID=UPI0030F5765B